MTRHSLPAAAFLMAVALFAPSVGHAQTFKVAKFNIGGDGGTDYLTAEPGTGRVFVSRGTHVMVVDGATGTVLGDIPDTPRTHGIALAPTSRHGFITNAGDSSVTLFDLRSLAVIKKIPVRTGGLDGIMYEDFSDRIILTNHSRPIGTAVAIDAKSGDVVGALGWDASQRLIYIPAGRDSNVTVVQQESPDKYTVVATVPTMRGAKTITVDPVKHVAYLFQPEYGPAPAPAPGSPPPAPGSRAPRGPVIAAWFFAISH